MTNPAALMGTFSELKMVKTRSVVQMVIEIPIEQGKQVVDAFGFPQPGSEIAVAVARIDVTTPKDEARNSANEPGSDVTTPKRKLRDLPYPQQVALTCQREAFWRYLEEMSYESVSTEDAAASLVRMYCKVTSRSQISAGSASAAAWDMLFNDFEDWLNNDPDIGTSASSLTERVVE